MLKGQAPDKVVFTSRIQIDAHTEPMAIRSLPSDSSKGDQETVRCGVTVVGDTLFAATIDSQAHAETEVDWRKTSTPDIAHATYELPTEIEEKCVALTRSLGLRFGALDFVLDRDGQLWFLEINPNGQWAWIENPK